MRYELVPAMPATPVRSWILPWTRQYSGVVPAAATSLAVVMTVPPAHGRYYLVQCMDAWTNVFAAPGIRTLGDRGARYAIVGPEICHVGEIVACVIAAKTACFTSAGRWVTTTGLSWPPPAFR